MQRKELIVELSNYVRETLMLKKLEIKPDDNLNDLGLDSMGAVEFVVNVEEAYNISINDDEVEKINTLNDAVDLVLEKIGRRE